MCQFLAYIELTIGKAAKNANALSKIQPDVHGMNNVTATLGWKILGLDSHNKVVKLATDKLQMDFAKSNIRSVTSTKQRKGDPDFRPPESNILFSQCIDTLLRTPVFFRWREYWMWRGEEKDMSLEQSLIVNAIFYIGLYYLKEWCKPKSRFLPIKDQALMEFKSKVNKKFGIPLERPEYDDVQPPPNWKNSTTVADTTRRSWVRYFFRTNSNINGGDKQTDLDRAKDQVEKTLQRAIKQQKEVDKKKQELENLIQVAGKKPTPVIAINFKISAAQETLKEHAGSLKKILHRIRERQGRGISDPDAENKDNAAGNAVKEKIIQTRALVESLNSELEAAKQAEKDAHDKEVADKLDSSSGEDPGPEDSDDPDYWKANNGERKKRHKAELSATILDLKASYTIAFNEASKFNLLIEKATLVGHEGVLEYLNMMRLIYIYFVNTINYCHKKPYRCYGYYERHLIRDILPLMDNADPGRFVKLAEGSSPTDLENIDFSKEALDAKVEMRILIKMEFSRISFLIAELSKKGAAGKADCDFFSMRRDEIKDIWKMSQGHSTLLATNMPTWKPKKSRVRRAKANSDSNVVAPAPVPPSLDLPDNTDVDNRKHGRNAEDDVVEETKRVRLDDLSALYEIRPNPAAFTETNIQREAIVVFSQVPGPMSENFSAPIPHPDAMTTSAILIGSMSVRDLVASVRTAYASVGPAHAQLVDIALAGTLLDLDGYLRITTGEVPAHEIVRLSQDPENLDLVTWLEHVRRRKIVIPLLLVYFWVIDDVN